MWGGGDVLLRLLCGVLPVLALFSRLTILPPSVFNDSTSISPRALSSRFPVHYFKSYFTFHLLRSQIRMGS